MERAFVTRTAFIEAGPIDLGFHDYLTLYELIGFVFVAQPGQWRWPLRCVTFVRFNFIG